MPQSLSNVLIHAEWSTKERFPFFTNKPLHEEFQWQAGYGTFSVSESKAEQVRAYIAKQEEHHQKITFQDEYRRFLKAHRIEWDERYVWD